MGLLSRLRGGTASAGEWQPPAWQPDSPFAELEGDDADMDDDGQACDRAYQVTYTSPDIPGRLITVCWYASGVPGDYSAGFRYQWLDEANPEPVFTDWGEVPDATRFASAAEADAEARVWAGGSVMEYDLTASVPWVFEWEGE